VAVKRLFLATLLVALSAFVAFAPRASAGDFADGPCFDASGPDSATCPAGTTGSPYSVTILPKDGAGCGAVSPQEWTVSSGSLPPGLTLASNGTAGAAISGTPTQAGNFAFYITVHNPYKEDPPGTIVCNGDYSDKKFTIPINPGVPKLTLGPESASTGTTGAPYALQVTASVPDAKTFSISTGALPAGLAINAATGLISGTPTAAGTFDFTVYAKVNADSRSDTKALEIVIRDPLRISVAEPFTTSRRAGGEVGVPFDATLEASGGVGTYTWSLASGQLPPGLTLADGAISGRPRTAGTYAFVAKVTDADGRSANYPARVVVAAKLAVVTTLFRPAKVGKLYGARLKTVGGVAPAAWRITLGPLPRGIRFDRTTGVLAGIPKRAGRYRLTFEATDSLGIVARKTLSLIVIHAPVRKR
jgi:hypothetical protein